MSTELDADDRPSFAVALAPAYRLLGELYLHPPTEQTVSAIQEWCRALPGESLPSDIEDAAGTILAAETELETLCGAFTRLLQGVSYGDSTPPPYESMYVDGMLNGPSSTEVDAFYLEAGVKLAVDDELIDHAGYELLFLATLCEHGDERRQFGFITTHVGDWLGAFHEQALESDPPEFYRGVFALTESLLDLHAQTLEETASWGGEN